MGSQMWIRLEQLEKLLFFVGSYLLPDWDTETDGSEREDREGNVLLGHFSVEEFNLASAEGAFRQRICIAVRLEQLLWSVLKARDWPKDSGDVNSLWEVVAEDDDYFLNCPPDLQEVKEGFEQGIFLVSPCGCLGDAMWWSRSLEHQGRVGASLSPCSKSKNLM